MSKHTPGPWEWDGKVWGYDSDNEAPWLVQAPWTDTQSKNVLTGSIKCGSEADARLIAAAPCLLEALRATRDALEVSYPLHSCDMDKRGAVLGQARAAIAKAEGQQ